MGLYELIENFLNGSNGKVSLEDLCKHLEEIYSRETIVVFLKDNTDVFYFDNTVVRLKNGRITIFLKRLEYIIESERIYDSELIKSIAELIFIIKDNPHDTIDDLFSQLNIPSQDYSRSHNTI